VQVGDTIVHAGTPHVVASVDRRNGFGWPIADCAGGWGIALSPDGRLEIPSPSLPALLKEWRTPSHDYGTGADPTAWLLFNAYTTVLGPRATSNPTDYAKRTMRLGLLLNNETAPATTTLAA
jgi:hypothetical protein